MAKAKLRRRGFTLIELLVVISIIAMLVSILLPVLASARKRAETLKCTTNSRQIGIALNMYANDWKMYIPLGMNVVTGVPGHNYFKESHWVTRIIPYMSQRIDPNHGIYTQTPKNEWWFCAAEAKQGALNYPQYGINYTIAGCQSAGVWSNTNAGNADLGTHSKQITRIKKPSKTLLTGELRGASVGYEYIAHATGGHGSNRMIYRHQGSANVLFFDTHVSLMKEPGLGERLDIAYTGGDTTRKLWE